MKNTKKIVLSLVAFSLTGTYVYATDMSTGTAVPAASGAVVSQEVPAVVSSVKVDSAEFLDEKTMSLKLSQALPGIAADSEVKVLEDLAVLKSSKDIDNAKKVKVELSADLIDGATFSLVSVSEGLDVSIDFTLSGDKSKILNPDFSQDETGIEYISVVDPRTVEVYVNKDIATPTVEFKMFKELKVESMFLDTTNLNVKMFDALSSKKDYIAILTLKDMENKDIEVENSLYDFTTPEFATPVVTEIAPLVDASIPVTDTMPPVTASGELAATGSGENIETVAMAAPATPDTGAKTNILLFLTFILTLAYFATRKKDLKA